MPHNYELDVAEACKNAAFCAGWDAAVASLGNGAAASLPAIAGYEAEYKSGWNAAMDMYYIGLDDRGLSDDGPDDDTPSGLSYMQGG